MSAPVSEGDVVLDKYRVERVLGRGGMGIVVAATHVDLDQKVALKFLLPEALEHPDIVERFAREARAAARIQSQHVVRVIDTGRMPSGAPFMVMEYLEGEDLSDLLDRVGRLSLDVAVDYVLQALEAIGEAHAAGIVHRDLKPSNLFLAKQRDRRQIVKVLDFGISKLEDPKSAPITRTATMMGSPHYMSPEQLVSSKDVDARSDVWALGVILYELVSGMRPFDGESMPEVVGKILRNAPERLGELVPGVGLDFELVVARCLSNEPENRYASVAELASALRPFASNVASASLSAERIARVLGAASVPPAADPSSDRAPIVLVPPSAPAGNEVAATVRPQARPQPETLPEAPEVDALAQTRGVAPSSSVRATDARSTAEVGRPASSSKRGVVALAVTFACAAGVMAWKRSAPAEGARLVASTSAHTAEVSPSASAATTAAPVALPDPSGQPSAPATLTVASASANASPPRSASSSPSSSPLAPPSTPSRKAPTPTAAAAVSAAPTTTAKSPLQMGIK